MASVKRELKKSRVGQNRVYTPYDRMTVCTYKYMVMANPKHTPQHPDSD